VAAEVQERVAQEFGFSNIQETVTWIRTAPAIYPECPEVKKIPHYQKFNRARDGELRVGDIIPDAGVSSLNGTKISLYNYIDDIFSNEKCTTEYMLRSVENTEGKLSSRKPVVICAGSYS